MIHASVMSWGGETLIRCSPYLDTLNPRIAQAIQTWKNYVSSSPDSLQEHALWPEKDKNERFSFDPARVWVFQSKEFMKTYPGLIVSAHEIEPGSVMIKTLFQGTDSTGLTIPIALYKVIVKSTGEEWHLEHVLDQMTSDWTKRTIGGITFVMSPEHRYSSGTARKAVRFCDSLTALFDLHDIEQATYFVAQSKEELASILGFDFFVSIPQGLTYPEKEYVFTAMDTEFHSHELAHLIFGSFSKTHTFIIEGISTWLGGSLGQSFETLSKLLAKEYVARPQTLSFDAVLKAGQQESLAFYTFGAIICKQVFHLSGGTGLKKFLDDARVESKDLSTVIARHLAIQEHEIDAFIKTSLLDSHTYNSD
ncbi:MAG: hypothetical protein ACO30M_08255 [Candidatus Kapaibacteriota bacterium]